MEQLLEGIYIYCPSHHLEECEYSSKINGNCDYNSNVYS